MIYAFFLIFAFFAGIFLLSIVPTILNGLTEKYFSKSISTGYFGATAKDERLSAEIIEYKAILDGQNRV